MNILAGFSEEPICLVVGSLLSFPASTEFHTIWIWSFGINSLNFFLDKFFNKTLILTKTLKFSIANYDGLKSSCTMWKSQYSLKSTFGQWASKTVTMAKLISRKIWHNFHNVSWQHWSNTSTYNLNVSVGAEAELNCLEIGSTFGFPAAVNWIFGNNWLNFFTILLVIL